MDPYRPTPETRIALVEQKLSFLDTSVQQLIVATNSNYQKLEGSLMGMLEKERASREGAIREQIAAQNEKYKEYPKLVRFMWIAGALVVFGGGIFGTLYGVFRYIAPYAQAIDRIAPALDKLPK